MSIKYNFNLKRYNKIISNTVIFYSKMCDIFGFGGM